MLYLPASLTQEHAVLRKLKANLENLRMTQALTNRPRGYSSSALGPLFHPSPTA